MNLDIDECARSNGNCSHICVNDIPYYHCDCPPGGQLDQSNTTCIFNANCTVENGQFSCECLSGFQDPNPLHFNCSGMSIKEVQ